ncbi:hypothetical protein FYJ38_00035 [Clostridium sp. WB02_MRS01]|uniref:hypothetical protein n=1 Tax=Clostridium sp. WB02_MRS01 TaxID=2605777 RepID=UPI0012B280C3|nr:hypothetical protein [Clostridium sp. WB02_MRS01]MSS07027.1 hypothetical protein [Clostridium sp. WB02_MRS01]
MILKEAYRYQNYLNTLIRDAESYLMKKDFITQTKQTHNRNKVNPDATDETIEVQKPYQVEYTPMDLVDFIVKAIDEKQKLSDAIVAAKKTAEIDIDSAIAMNKVKQNYVSILNNMANTKASERTTTGTDYKFNINNEQVSYRYEVSEVVSIDYDRNDVKSLSKKLTKETDEISTKLDAIELTTIVEYNPIWDYDNLEDVVLL